jgi:adenine-specific DNA-methyltransferase
MKKNIDYRHPYLSQQIIAYIGNKRRLLPLLHKAIMKCFPNISGGLTFLDMFAGSGAVSRFAKYLGFKVYSNDWEYFTYVINKAYLEVDDKDLKDMFQEQGGISCMIEHLNNLPDPDEDKHYIAKYYSPSTLEIENLDFKKERMFYTRKNGLIIDKIRNKIEEIYPEEDISEKPEKLREKHLLIALLLYEAATHTNTSGVFKAYHKGFGGHNRDALARILAPIELKMPVLISSVHRAEVFKEDAAKLIVSQLISDCELDMVYLDPPYNQHQYGSNYHLLNTISLWDKPAVNNEFNKSGSLSEKAAIRKDWTRTRSVYCYRYKATNAFYDLLKNIKSRHILISYSTEGIIPFVEMRKMCSEKGKISLVTDEYIKYRGGKQSIRRLNRNIEFVMMVDTSGRTTGHSLVKLNNTLDRRRLALMFNNRYSLEKLQRHFLVDFEAKTIKLKGSSLTIKTKGFFELYPCIDIESISFAERQVLIENLEKSVCSDKEEELAQLLEKISSEKQDAVYYVKKIPDTIRKFAHKKYKDKYYLWLERIKKLEDSNPVLYTLIRDKINNLEMVAGKRFTG